MKGYFHIKDHSWIVAVYVLGISFDSKPILSHMRALGAKGKDLLTVEHLMQFEGFNWGFTFSSYEKRQSLMVIGAADSRKELFDTIIHETFHLAKHIAYNDNIDPFSEDVAYIAGGLAGEIFDMCDM